MSVKCELSDALFLRAGLDTAERDAWSSSRRDNIVPAQQCLFKITVPPPVCRTDLMLTGSVCRSLYDYQYNPAEARSCVLVSQLARIQTDSVADTLKELYSDIHLEIGENHPSLLPQGPVEALCLFLTTAAGISVNVYAISDNGQIRVELNNYYNILLALSNCFIIQVKKRVQTLLD